jgi:Uma2 family endonuclease
MSEERRRMIAALADLLETQDGGWTTDDLDELPETTRHVELIDGVLIVSPSPTSRHQSMVFHLCSTLDARCPESLVVTQGVEVRISRHRSLTPDVLVVTAEAAAPGPSKFRPEDVVLAVEIVSPGSKALDRVLKPALYGEAGVGCYWRIEQEPFLHIIVNELAEGAGAYTEIDAFREVLDVKRPWPITLSVPDLLPKVYRRP